MNIYHILLIFIQKNYNINYTQVKIILDLIKYL